MISKKIKHFLTFIMVLMVIATPISTEVQAN